MMNTSSPAISGITANTYPSTQEHACPRCNGQTYRIHRRFVDLIINIFVPIHRYQCASCCGWEGNMRDKNRGLKR